MNRKAKRNEYRNEIISNNEDIKNELIYIKCEIEDYFHKKGDCDGSIWTEQGIINFIYEKINQLIKD